MASEICHNLWRDYLLNETIPFTEMTQWSNDMFFSGDSIFSESDYINPDDTWQYLYKLTPKMVQDERSNVKVCTLLYLFSVL